MALKCANNGCGKTFTLEENNDTACIHHSGSAVFHEGLKGWSCCKKRVISFEEFMDIPGCSCGSHLPEEKKAQAEKKPANTVSSSTAPPAASITAPVAKTITPAPKVAPSPPQEDNDPPDAIIAPGTLCKRLGCNQLYHDERAKEETCIHHPGVPIFHEGSKGYTCCKMVGDFDEFLKMPGCKKGKHKFIETKKENTTNRVECRHDWYQMGPNVVVNVYAKGIDKQNSTVTFGPQSLSIDLILPEGKSFSKTFKLAQVIDPSKSKFEFMSVKAEIKLYKTEGSQWASLE